MAHHPPLRFLSHLPVALIFVAEFMTFCNGSRLRVCLKWRWLAVVGLLLAGLPGCSEPDPIQVYTVKRPAAPGSLWFFKLVGPSDAVGATEPAMTAFVQSIRFDERTGLPSWRLPEGWTEAPSSSSVRYKTLTIPGSPELEIAVTQIGGKVPLSLEDERAQATMLHDQVTMPAQSEAEASAAGDGKSATDKPVKDLAADAKVIQAGPLSARMFDYSGETLKFGKTRLLAAMVAVPVPPEATGSRAGASAQAAPTTVPFTYTAPAEWSAAPRTQFSLLSMMVTQGDEKATVTVTPAMGDIIMNVNRWRGQAGLDPATSEQLAEELEPLTVDGVNMLFVNIVGEERSILGAIMQMQGQTWFIKLDGSPKLVSGEVERFRSFLQSIREIR